MTLPYGADFTAIDPFMNPSLAPYPFLEGPSDSMIANVTESTSTGPDSLIKFTYETSVSDLPSNSLPIDGMSTPRPISKIPALEIESGSNSPDMVLQSSDTILFYVNASLLLSASSNMFNSLIPVANSAPLHRNLPMLNLPESSRIIIVVLHTVYNIPFQQHIPTFRDIELAIASFEVYGIFIAGALSTGSPLHGIVLSFAPTKPIETYAFAAKYEIADLAKCASGHLMSFQLSNITDEMAEKIGARYLKKLVLFHMDRLSAVG